MTQPESDFLPRVLLQIDSDQHPSVFDAIVAVDSGVDHLLRHGAVSPAQVTELVHGTIFTRGPKDLKSSAIYVGGSDVSCGEALLEAVQQTFFGPMRVSVMMDSNGANTTAAAAVLSAEKHVDLHRTQATVLAATGPVGQRVVRLLASQGAVVRVGSRSAERAGRRANHCVLGRHGVDRPPACGRLGSGSLHLRGLLLREAGPVSSRLFDAHAASLGARLQAHRAHPHGFRHALALARPGA